MHSQSSFLWYATHNYNMNVFSALHFAGSTYRVFPKRRSNFNSNYLLKSIINIVPWISTVAVRKSAAPSDNIMKQY
jgi:hypothetical protein